VPELNELIKEVMENSAKWGFNVTPDYDGILMEALCLCGEVGEFANCIKKLPRTLSQRNGITEEQLIVQAWEEMIDILIYWCKLAHFLGMDVDADWKRKQAILQERWGGSK